MILWSTHYPALLPRVVSSHCRARVAIRRGHLRTRGQVAIGIGHVWTIHSSAKPSETAWRSIESSGSRLVEIRVVHHNNTIVPRNVFKKNTFPNCVINAASQAALLIGSEHLSNYYWYQIITDDISDGIWAPCAHHHAEKSNDKLNSIITRTCTRAIGNPGNLNVSIGGVIPDYDRIYWLNQVMWSIMGGDSKIS